MTLQSSSLVWQAFHSRMTSIRLSSVNPYEPPNPEVSTQFIGEIEEVSDPPIEGCDTLMMGLGFLDSRG